MLKMMLSLREKYLAEALEYETSIMVVLLNPYLCLSSFNIYFGKYSDITLKEKSLPTKYSKAQKTKLDTSLLSSENPPMSLSAPMKKGSRAHAQCVPYSNLKF